MPPLTIGVAIITYNGLRYLPEQLGSIVQQTRAVDHIVISDDRSTDGTWEYLEAWASQAPMRVTLIRNETQLGLRGNFEQAIGAVEADVIFTADQDDVWIPGKVALMCAVFEQDPAVLLVHTDAILVDGDGRDMGKTLLGELNLSSAERAAIHAGHALSVNYRRNVVTGATVAIRRTLLALARPFPPIVYHDAWLALLAAATGKVRLLDTATIHYRQHGGNLVGMKKMGAWMKFRHLLWRMQGPLAVRDTINETIVWRQALHERLANDPQTRGPSRTFAAGGLAFYQQRATLPLQPVSRAAAILGNLVTGRYSKFSYTPWSDVLRDVFNK
jgi:glycosyltransferase involved in cell wall biosynthesis